MLHMCVLTRIMLEVMNPYAALFVYTGPLQNTELSLAPPLSPGDVPGPGAEPHDLPPGELQGPGWGAHEAAEADHAEDK